MNQTLQHTLKRIEQTVPVDASRKQVLQPLIDFIVNRQKANEPVLLHFICTHNSRRSHIAQLWAAAASQYCDLENIECYSGGTEETRIHPNAIEALESQGFELIGEDVGDNPHFLAQLDEALMVEVFSKRYDDDLNPSKDFLAVMVCDEAAQNCPFVAGASNRISLPYEDPKEFDNAPNPLEGYQTRSTLIASEILYAMRTASNKLSI